MQQAAERCREIREHGDKMIAVAPDSASTCAREYWMWGAIGNARQHVLPALFDVVAICGEGGARLRENIER